MLTARTPVQRTKTANPYDFKQWSTYQSHYGSVGVNHHGSLIKHQGNDAYLPSSGSPVFASIQRTKRPFISPSYQNLTSQSFISNRVSDNYTNNYRTSQDNPLHRPLYVAPVRTKLAHLYQTDIKSVAPLDPTALYEHSTLDGMVNDHFVSKKWLKTETMNLRDAIVS
jgi:hypothetical protein